jgi:hypothetical protein
MTPIRLRLCTLPLFFGLALLTGCGTSAPPLAAVKGTVSYRGHLLPGGTIVFTPDAARGGRGEIAHASIAPDGSFTLHTGPSPGAAVGWHRITVVAVREPVQPASYQAFPLPQILLPEKYSSPDLSGLVREVKAGEENVIHIELD